MNAADFVYNFFKTDNVATADEAGYRFPDLVAALDEIDKALTSWKIQGSDVEVFEDCLPRWRESVTAAFTPGGNPVWSPVSGPQSTGSFLSAGDAGCLKWVGEKLAESTLTFTTEQRDRLSSLLEESVAVIKELSNLPTGLVKYLFRLISETKEALDEFEITGDFKLERAFTRLREALDITISNTKPEDGKKWEGVKSKLAEIGTGFIIAAPSFVLDTVGLMNQLQIGS